MQGESHGILYIYMCVCDGDGRGASVSACAGLTNQLLSCRVDPRIVWKNTDTAIIYNLVCVPVCVRVSVPVKACIIGVKRLPNNT